jgi:uncharacterized SAM-binding protein YcdF (DUF218 family)
LVGNAWWRLKRFKRDDMASPNASKHSRWPIYLLVCLVVGLAVVISARGAGRWLVREDTLSSADVIVILSGSMPYRAEEASKLFNRGEAHEVWVSRTVNPAGRLQAMGIHFVGEEEYSREVLVHFGVPESSVHILPDPIVNTQEEVNEIASEMLREGKTKVIIVTSPQHTRRVRALWNKLVGGRCQAVVRAAFEDPFDPTHWWRNTRDMFSVFREMLGLVNAWTGLPVAPSST